MSRSRRLTLVAAGAAAAALALPAAAAAQVPGMSFYKVTSATGTYDHTSEYRPPCEGPGYAREQHADFSLRRTSKGAGGMLINRVGSLVIPVKGGFDGVYRGFDCHGAVTQSCEVKYFYADRDAFISLAFRRGGRVTATVTQAQVPNCPLPLAAAIYVGQTRVSRAKLRKRRFTLTFRDTIELKDGEPEQVVGSEVANLKVVVRRAAS